MAGSGLEVQIDMRQVVALAEAWRAAPQIVRDEMGRAMTEALLLLEREVKELTPVGVGGGAGLKGSIAAGEPQRLGDEVIGVVGTSLPYALPVELGSKPHFPPVEPLEEWARIKLGVPASEARGVGFAIARKIAAKGTNPVKMFTRAFAANRVRVVRIFDASLRRIAARLAES